jgi:hypothetical protein
MPILAVCPHCQQNYHVDEKFAGKSAKCQACGKSFAVPVPQPDPLGDVAALASALPSLAPPEYTVAPAPSNPLRGPGNYTPPASYAAPERSSRRGSGIDLSAGDPVEWALRPGVTCSILGVGGFVLPLVGLQFKVLAFLGTAAPVIGGILAAAGAVLLFLALRDNVIKALGASVAVIVFAAAAFLLNFSITAKENEQIQDLAKPLEHQPRLIPPNNPPGQPGNAPDMAAMPPATLPPGAPPGATTAPAVPATGNLPVAALPPQEQETAPREPPPKPKLQPLKLDAPSVALPRLTTAVAEAGPNGKLRGRKAEFEDFAPEGGCLVGMRVIHSANWGGAILGLEPIYQVEGEYVVGTLLYGSSPPASQSILLAKPGFAVSGMRYHAGLVINSLQLEFREVSGQRLIAEGAYASERVGCEGGSQQPAIHGGSEPIRGIDGTAREDLTSLRLYHANSPSPRQ